MMIKEFAMLIMCFPKFHVICFFRPFVQNMETFVVLVIVIR